MTYVSTAALINVNAGHFNSTGMEGSGKYAKAVVKKISIEGKQIPFISPQALRKYVRSYIEIKQNQSNYYERVKRKTSKKDFLIHDPINYFEDDFLGYSQPLYQNPNKENNPNRLKTASTNRRSPFLTNGLIGVEDACWIHDAEGWVHPSNGTPLPYKAEFSTGYFQSLFGLECDRIGMFENYGDIIEMDPALFSKYKNDLEVTHTEQKTCYTLKKQSFRQKEALKMYGELILNLYGGGKSTMFAEPLHPSLTISIITKINNTLPGDLFISENNQVKINTTNLLEFLNTWGKHARSPLLVGYRAGSVGTALSKQLENLNGQSINGVEIKVFSPGKAMKMIQEVFVI